MILGLRVNKDKIMSLHEKRSPVLTFVCVKAGVSELEELFLRALRTSSTALSKLNETFGVFPCHTKGID